MPRNNYFIPQNVFKKKQIFRNLSEGLFESFILFSLLAGIPFTTKVRWIVFLATASFVMIINLLGIQNNSLIQTLLLKIKYKKLLKKTYSYRRFKDGVKRDHAEVIKNGKVVTIRSNRTYKYIQSLLDG